MIVKTQNSDPTVQETQPLVQENTQENVQENAKKSDTEIKIDPTDPPKKKLDKSKAKQWVLDLYKSNGREIDDASATKFAEHKNIKLMMSRQFRITTGKVPEQKDLDKIYGSWEVDIDPVDEVLQNSTLLNNSIPPNGVEEKKKSTPHTRYGLGLGFGRWEFFIGLRRIF
jgi:hypothetical protein